jgi:hypothetical protein
MIKRVMIVTPRYDREFRELMERVVSGDPSVSVIEDRRVGQRRKRVMMRTGSDRRKGDRRGRQRSDAGTIVVFREAAAATPASMSANSGS